VDEGFRPWADLGDLLTEQGKHKEAAAWLEKGWRKAPDNPILLYLNGRALVRAGDATEGKRRMDLAHVVPLGNVPLRGRFLEELVNRGHAAAMRTEIVRIRDTAWSLGGSSVGNVWNQVGRAGVVLKEYATAADAQQRGMHFVLKTSGILYVEGYAYANVPALVRGLDARHLLTQGKVKESLAAADESLAIVPTHTETLIGLVHELDKRGHPAEAEAAFRRGWDAYAAAIKANPKSVWLKYSAAWLAAGCRRELDAAKRYAAEATAAEPSHRGYRECLAEVSFRTGDRAKATEVMTALAAEDYRNWHLKRQLTRYMSGAIDSPLPFTDE
jgi:tetratricopeptide (TPR) repeat protein